MTDKYTNWILNHVNEITELEKQNDDIFQYEPVVSIVVPIVNIPEQYLCNMIESVLQQTYKKWELCIIDEGIVQYPIEKIISRYGSDYRKIVTQNNTVLNLTQGDYIGLLHHESILAPFALHEVVKALNVYKKPDFVYSDINKCKYVPSERSSKVRNINFICHFSVLKQSHIKDVCSAFDGNQDDNIILRAIENANRVAYIPQKLSCQNSDKHVKMLWEVDQIPTLGSEITASPKITRDINSIKSDLRMTRKKELKAFLSGGRHLNFSSPSSPKITILLILWNQAELTLACLEALHSQDNGSFEILIVNNASSDATEKLLSVVSGVRIIDNDENIGFLKAVNRGAHQAHGSYLLLLNNDAVVRPGSIEQAINRIESDPTIGAIGGRVILPDGSLQEAGSIVWQDGSCLGYMRGELPDSNEAMFVRDVDYCSGVFLLTSTELFCQMGGFDVKYAPAYYEETDYCIRLWKRGLRVVYDPSVVLDHFEYGSAAVSEQAKCQMEINKNKFFATHKDFLKNQHHNNPKNRLYARLRNKYMGRVLFMDDRVPLKNLGSGFPRAKAILQTMAEKGWFISFYPLDESNLADDWKEIYEAIPQTVEVIRGYGQRKLEQFLIDRAGYYDILFVSRPTNMAKISALYSTNQDLFSGLKIIYDAEAIWSIREIQEAEIQGKPISQMEAAQRINNELTLAQVSDAILAVSDHEAQYFKTAGYNNVSVLGYALEVNPTTKSFDERKDILFVGRLEEDGSPNVDSVVWFTSEVLPLINAGREEHIRLYLAGKNGAKQLKEIDSPDVIFLGPIDDLTGWYNNCKIFIAPTRFAAGIPLKVPEACAYGIPVVLTPILEKELNWEQEQDVLVGNTAENFAEQCKRLYYDKELWQQVRENAIKRIVTDHSIVQFANTLTKVLSN